MKQCLEVHILYPKFIGLRTYIMYLNLSGNDTWRHGYTRTLQNNSHMFQAKKYLSQTWLYCQCTGPNLYSHHANNVSLLSSYTPSRLFHSITNDLPKPTISPQCYQSEDYSFVFQKISLTCKKPWPDNVPFEEKLADITRCFPQANPVNRTNVQAKY